jgi:lysozyme
MSLVDQSLVQLRRDEGEVLHVYQDTEGFWTIGVGVLVDERKGGGITKEESAYLFRNRFNKVIDALQSAFPWFGTLSEARRGVLINMTYQMGLGGVKGFPKFLQYLQQGNYEKAAAEMLDSKWAKQTPERAKRLSEQMKTDRWQ